MDFDTLGGLFNELEDILKRGKSEIARLSNADAVPAIKDEAVQASGDSADQTVASVTTDEPSAPVGSDSSPVVEGTIEDTTAGTTDTTEPVITSADTPTPEATDESEAVPPSTPDTTEPVTEPGNEPIAPVGA